MQIREMQIVCLISQMQIREIVHVLHGIIMKSSFILSVDEGSTMTSSLFGRMSQLVSKPLTQNPCVVIAGNDTQLGGSCTVKSQIVVKKLK
jgi:hypothetical protein